MSTQLRFLWPKPSAAAQALLRLGRSCKHDTPPFHHHCFSASNVMTSEGGHRRNSRGECSVFSKTKKNLRPRPHRAPTPTPASSVFWTWTEEDFTLNSLPQISRYGQQKITPPPNQVSLTCCLWCRRNSERKPASCTYGTAPADLQQRGIFSCLGEEMSIKTPSISKGRGQAMEFSEEVVIEGAEARVARNAFLNMDLIVEVTHSLLHPFNLSLNH